MPIIAPTASTCVFTRRDFSPQVRRLELLESEDPQHIKHERSWRINSLSYPSFREGKALRPVLLHPPEFPSGSESSCPWQRPPQLIAFLLHLNSLLLHQCVLGYPNKIASLKSLSESTSKETHTKTHDTLATTLSPE